MVILSENPKFFRASRDFIPKFTKFSLEGIKNVFILAKMGFQNAHIELQGGASTI